MEEAVVAEEAEEANQQQDNKLQDRQQPRHPETNPQRDDTSNLCRR